MFTVNDVCASINNSGLTCVLVCETRWRLSCRSAKLQNSKAPQWNWVRGQDGGEVLHRDGFRSNRWITVSETPGAERQMALKQSTLHGQRKQSLKGQFHPQNQKCVFFLWAVLLFVHPDCFSGSCSVLEISDVGLLFGCNGTRTSTLIVMHQKKKKRKKLSRNHDLRGWKANYLTQLTKPANVSAYLRRSSVFSVQWYGVAGQT